MKWGTKIMAFEPIEKTPGVSPLLVRLYDTHNLYSLAQNKGSGDACLELTTVMVDLLTVKLSEKESELITDVLLALMKQAESDLKIALSERLSSMENVPLRMILALANDEISIADSVLRNSPVLHDMDLAYILKAQGIEHGRSIAVRPGLSGALIDLLADMKDLIIAQNLASNDRIDMTTHAFDIIADMAQDHEDLAQPLASRGDLPKEIADKIYRFVSNEIQKQLHERFGNDANKLIIELEDVTQEITHPALGNENTYSQLIETAQRLRRAGELRLSTIIAALRRGQPATFMADLAVYADLPIDIVKRLLKQETGRGLAIICKLRDVPKSDFVSLYLLTERFRSNTKRIINHMELSRIMVMYDGITATEARNAVKNTYH